MNSRIFSLHIDNYYTFSTNFVNACNLLDFFAEMNIIEIGVSEYIRCPYFLASGQI